MGEIPNTGQNNGGQDPPPPPKRSPYSVFNPNELAGPDEFLDILSGDECADGVLDLGRGDHPGLHGIGHLAQHHSGLEGLKEVGDARGRQRLSHQRLNPLTILGSNMVKQVILHLVAIHSEGRIRSCSSCSSSSSMRSSTIRSLSIESTHFSKKTKEEEVVKVKEQ